MYYRNITDIVTDQGVEVDAGSLWKLDEETFIVTLVDEDQHLTAKHTVEVFQYALKEYVMEFTNVTEFPKIYKCLQSDITAFALSGNYKTNILRFGFKSLLEFTEVFRKLGNLDIEKIDLQTVS